MNGLLTANCTNASLSPQKYDNLIILFPGVCCYFCLFLASSDKALLNERLCQWMVAPWELLMEHKNRV